MDKHTAWLIFIVTFCLESASSSFYYGQPCSERNTAYLQPVEPKLPLAPAVANCVDITSAKKILAYREDLRNYTDFFRQVAPVADTLYADHMNLTRFPALILRLLPNLETVDLSGNRLRRVPPKLYRLTPNISKLLLADNAIKVPKRSPLVASPTLKTLMLSGNGIGALYKYTFSKVPALEVLYLDGNKIRTIEPILGTMPNLKYIHLGQNYLSIIPERAKVSKMLVHYIVKSQKVFPKRKRRRIHVTHQQDGKYLVYNVNHVISHRNR